MMCTLTIKFLSPSKNPTRPSHPAWSCLLGLHPRSSVLARKRQNYTGTKTRKDRKIDSQFWNDKTSSPAAPRLRQFKRVQTNFLFGSGSKFIDRTGGEHISILSDRFWWEAWVRLPGERHNVGSINTLLGVTPISCREIDHLDSRNPLLDTERGLCHCVLFLWFCLLFEYERSLAWSWWGCWWCWYDVMWCNVRSAGDTRLLGSRHSPSCLARPRIPQQCVSLFWPLVPSAPPCY